MNPIKAFDRYCHWAIDRTILEWMILAMWTIFPVYLTVIFGPIILIIWILTKPQ